MAEASVKIAIILTLILLGYLCKRVKIFKEGDGDAFTRIIFNFTLPSVIISIFSEFTIDPSFLIYPLIGFLLGFFMLAVGLLLFRGYKGKAKGQMIIPLLGLNVGLFAVPLVQAIWGDEALKHLLLIDSGNAFIVFGLSYITATVFSNGGEKVGVRKVLSEALRSVPFLIYILTLLLKGFGTYYPSFIVDLASIIAKANTPLAMITLGVFLSFHFSREQFRMIAQFWMTRYFFGLAAGLAFFFLAPIGAIGKAMVLVAFILPCSFATITYAVKFRYDARLVGTMVNTTIVTSIVILWILSFLIRLP